MSSADQKESLDGKKKKKMILLDLSRTERAFTQTESLWDIEIEKIEDRLASHITSLQKYENEKDSGKKPLLSIAILGYPGSGKTSLLQTLVEMIKNKECKNPNLKNVFSLPVLKPKLVTSDDHFLYAFLAEALRKDREKHKNEFDYEKDMQIISRVHHKFQEVSEYLQVLNTSGNSNDGDPLGVSLERLERHESGIMLIEKMGEFIDQLANSLCGDSQSSIILLPVDDADMSQDVLVSALDTCWRFIRHPRLVPIFTFSGRLAEELLRVQYDEKINKGNSSEKLKEASTSLLITENMAIQYLGKLFPVRNRIKIGLASSRMQVAEYQPYKNVTGNKVSSLLETASIFLFGHVHFPIVHPIRPPLRVVTLRRQIQIIDAIQGIGFEKFMKTDAPKPESRDKRHSSGDNNPVQKGVFNSVGRLYDLAAWSLLNAHRDILKEINLNLDDLYGWTPKGLRQVVLDSILNMNLDDRLKLLKQWRYRSEDRRSQVISLLATNVFRPLMAEEPTADESIEGIRNWWDAYNTKKPENDSDSNQNLDQTSFSVMAGMLWFLNLCIGFYLPQILAKKRRISRSADNSEADNNDRITGIGWDLMSGPTHAVREALNNKRIFSSGILFLEPDDFNKPLKDINPNKNKRFFYHLWCSYGFHDGWPWAAISLWRGLGLMGKMIEFYYKNHKNLDRKTLEKGIIEIIKYHCESALVAGNFPRGEIIPKCNNFLFKDWEYKDENSGELDSIEHKIIDFSKEILLWLDSNQEVKRLDETTFQPDPVENRIFPMERKDPFSDWQRCFIRRLHGENLISVFWQKLENAYYKKILDEWTSLMILSQWKDVLLNYWEGCAAITDLIKSCPIWLDFEKTNNKKSTFNWGQSKEFNPTDEEQDTYGIHRAIYENYLLFSDAKVPPTQAESPQSDHPDSKKKEQSENNDNNNTGDKK